MPSPIPNPSIPIEQQPDDMLVGMLLWGEARQCHDDCRIAICHVLNNRVLSSKYGGNTYRGVVLAHSQFSEFNPNNPEHNMLLEPLKHDKVEVWESSYGIGQLMLAGKLGMDMTQRATNFHSYKDPLDHRAPWAITMVHTLDILPFHFFRNNKAYDAG